MHLLLAAGNLKCWIVSAVDFDAYAFSNDQGLHVLSFITAPSVLLAALEQSS